MKYIVLVLGLVLSGCSTVIPITQKWPEPPGTLVQEVCAELQKLPDDPKLSQVATVVANNYTEYYMCSAKLEAWQRWYREQKIIYQGLK